jgi:hypothetical protein
MAMAARLFTAALAVLAQAMERRAAVSSRAVAAALAQAPAPRVLAAMAASS